MRVLVTVPWAQQLGGAETMLQSLLAGAREEGHELEPVFFEEGEWAQRLRGEGVRVEVVQTGRLRELHRLPGALLRLRALIRVRQPDLVLNWAGKTQLYGSPAAVLAGAGRRVVWWQHSIPSGDSWLDRFATLLPAAAIGCTSGAAARAQARLRPARPTFVVAAGAAAARNGRSPRAAGVELPSDVPIVGLVGRLQAWKGQDRLLRAQALLRERGVRMHTMIVGGDAWGFAGEYAASLPALIEELGLSGEVTQTGQVPDAGPYIEQMDVLVNASDPEPFGIVLLEGMSRGVAVLAVDSGGPAEFIRDGETGALARSGEPAALADALEPLLRSPERRASLARAGHESFLRDYTDAAMRKRFFAELDQVLERLSAPSRPGRSR